MDNVEKTILDQLVKLEDGITQMKSGGEKPDFVALFKNLDELTLQLPSGTDSQLLHYLHKKSYEKARLYLEGRDAENANGGCLRD